MDADQPVVTPDTPTPIPEDGSLADHEAAFGHSGTSAVETPEASEIAEAETPQTGERDDKGRFRHRAKSQQAGPTDVPRIAELTKRLREAERRAEDAERRATTRHEPTERRTEPASVASSFTDTEPTLDQFASEADPYSAYVRALGRFDRKKEAHEAKQAEQAEREKVTAHERQDAERQMVEGYASRRASFVQTHPDYDAVVKACPVKGMTPVLDRAIFTHDKSAEVVYYLAQHPDVYDEMLLSTIGAPVDDAFVAIVQRRLSSRLQAASTGSAVTPRAPSPAPRPPNPVRTGPMHTGDDLPGDESSLADHERAFGKPRRR